MSPVTLVRTRWSSGNLQFLDAAGNVIFEIQSAARALSIPSGASLSDVNGYSVDGLGSYRVARATYDFAVKGGAIGAIGLGVTLPDNAVVIGGFVDVITTCTTAGADAGTMAIHVESAGDIVAAIAVSDVSNPWDAGKHAIVPKANTPESTGVKLTAARQITATIAGQAFTAGKFVVFLFYVLSE